MKKCMVTYLPSYNMKDENDKPRTAEEADVTYPYMNMGNVHRMFITYIHRT